MTKFKGKYQVNSPRAKFWDYEGDGVYFRTICTKDKIQYFGKIENSVLIPSETGLKTELFWHQIPIKFPFVELDYFFLMPNHLHGILGVYKEQNPPVQTRFIACPFSTASAENKTPGGITGLKNPMGQRSLDEIIRWFKGRTSFEVRKTNPEFIWHSGYDDHIIRNSLRYEFICNYIAQNPENWRNIHSITLQ